MRAITYDRFGPAEDVLQLQDLPIPELSPGDVLVRLKTSGVNPSDTRARAGNRPGVTKPPFPCIIPHSDGAGIIESVGENISDTRIGERVWIWNGQWQRAFGTAADYIALPSDQAVKLPPAVSFEEGAVLGIPALTACHAVLKNGEISGKTVLIHGGAGSVGRLAIQVARASDAHVLATARGKEGFALAYSAGAEHVFDYSAPNLADQILSATGGQLIHRIIDVEFGKNIDTNTRVIAEHGIITAYGSAGEMTPTLPFYPLMFKAVRLDLILVYILSDSERKTAIQKLTALLEQSKLDFNIAQTLPLEDCAKAHDLLTTGGRSGAVVLTV